MFKFLIIDDKLKQIHFIATFLKKQFPESIILSALNGKEGIEIAERESPNLILLDLVMPGMDGIQTLNLLKQNDTTKDVPVIIITATSNENEQKIKSLAAGADYFIFRPENIGELLPQITSLLRRQGFFIPKIEKKESNYKNYLTQEIQTSNNREKALKRALSDLRKAHEKIEQQNSSLSNEINEKNILLKNLQESERKFKFLFDSAFDLIFLLEITDENIQINDINQVALEKLGYEKGEITKLKISELYSEREDKLNKFIFEANLGKVQQKVEFTHKTKEGKNFTVEAQAKVLKLFDKNLIYLRERDITNEIQMLNKLRMFSRIIQLSPASVIITDINGKIEYVNQSFTEITGYSEKEILGQVPCILSIDYYDDESYRNLWNILKGGDVWIGEFRNKKNTGEPFWELSSITPIIDKDGVLKNFAIISQDITEQKELIEELKIAKAEAEKSDRLKSEFLARISHEIRTPLNTIINFTQILFEELSGEKSNIVKISQDAIISASKRIQRTIELILNMAQIESGTIEYKAEEFDLIKDCIKPLTDEYSPIIEQKNLHLNLNIETNETKLTADRYTVFQIFSNLIDNAVKFTSQGEIKISVNRNEENNLSVSVEDTGAGIADEYLPEIFKPFTQEESGYSRHFEGIGLGMALVKKYCDLNHAEIDIKSEKQKGTKVTVTFNEYKQSI